MGCADKLDKVKKADLIQKIIDIQRATFKKPGRASKSPIKKMADSSSPQKNNLNETRVSRKRKMWDREDHE